MIRIQNLKLPLQYDEETLRNLTAKKCKIPVSSVEEVILKKRSIDAREQPDIFYVATVDAKIKGQEKFLKKCKDSRITVAKDPVYHSPEHGENNLKNRPVIVGAGPAGLFCAYLLAKEGYAPILLERGDSVEQRTAAVEHFWKTGELNLSSNIQFGEGGAGTFSDGKLNTGVKDEFGRNKFVLQTFVDLGADPDILYVNKPHIGTDVLRYVIQNLRQEIIKYGGEIHFQSQVTDLTIENGTLSQITINNDRQMDCDVLILAIGHSARDTFQLLEKKGLNMSPKSFAVGLRIEHPQEMINLAKYGVGQHDLLPTADYKLTRKLENGRGIYSFCMCPGGYVVNASSEEHMVAVNGMSYRNRDARNANSAMVVTVTPEDFGHPGILGGVEFQRDLERFAYRAGNGNIPVQLFGDFRQNRASTSFGDVKPCIKGSYKLTNLREGLPAFLSDSLEKGILAFENYIQGFSREDALLSGIESRTSSPVKIHRNSDFTSNIEGIYPCGEGAGYAGGITSAAMDGLKVAEAVIKKYRNF